MEEEKAAAYYDELTRKGEGAARFKQGLGFSTDSDAAPKPGSALASSSSFLSNFVRASSPSKASEFEKQAQFKSIQDKLKKKPTDETRPSRVSDRSHRPGDDDGHSTRRRSRSRERRGDRDSRASGRRSRSRDKYRERDRESRRRSRSRDRYRDRDSERRRRRSRSRSDSDEGRRHRRRGRSRSTSPRERRSGRRSRSSSPLQHWRSEKSDINLGDRRNVSKTSKEKNAGPDYARLIRGYDEMSPAERVKAKMKLQLSATAQNDSEKGVGWERFEFNKDAPLDDEEIEVAEDDASLVKHIGQSFRFSAVEARREEQIKAAHEEAMFGAPVLPPSTVSDSEPERENNEKEDNRKDLVTSLLSESVLANKKGTWRDRVRAPEA
ncbi:serine/Arginine-related protein 53 [Neltuma alba]|uniref:serine/Arginine-related protein 53 n=1 Tax=Neltuma alba TaxID=207710 RepID=UPI0010A52035|nr:serine/Arginine-related protein 53 [Prosopis alba]